MVLLGIVSQPWQVCLGVDGCMMRLHVIRQGGQAFLYHVLVDNSVRQSQPQKIRRRRVQMQLYSIDDEQVDRLQGHAHMRYCNLDDDVCRRLGQTVARDENHLLGSAVRWVHECQVCLTPCYLRYMPSMPP